MERWISFSSSIDWDKLINHGLATINCMYYLSVEKHVPETNEPCPMLDFTGANAIPLPVRPLCDTVLTYKKLQAVHVWEQWGAGLHSDRSEFIIHAEKLRFRKSHVLKFIWNYYQKRFCLFISNQMYNLNPLSFSTRF